MLRLILMVMLFHSLGCSQHKARGTGELAEESGQSVKEPTQRLAIGPASSAQCPAGGMTYTVYGDADNNGAFNSSDVMVDQQIVCNGVDGRDGLDGSDGASMVFETLSASLEQCASGGSLILMAVDEDHSNTLTSEDLNHAAIVICNGSDGRDGADGQNAALPQFVPVEAIQACGNSVAYKEVLFRLANGQVLGSFSDNINGKMTRLAFLPDGTYMNTDNSGCVFSLSSEGSTRSISWSGQIQASWQIVP